MPLDWESRPDAAGDAIRPWMNSQDWVGGVRWLDPKRVLVAHGQPRPPGENDVELYVIVDLEARRMTPLSETGLSIDAVRGDTILGSRWTQDGDIWIERRLWVR